MMFITGYAFGKAVLMLYSLLRFVLQQNDFFENQFLLRIAWEAFYISNMVITVYISGVLADEVISCNPFEEEEEKLKKQE